jgi:hypothetical protein
LTKTVPGGSGELPSSSELALHSLGDRDPSPPRCAKLPAHDPFWCKKKFTMSVWVKADLLSPQEVLGGTQALGPEQWLFL